MHMPVYLRVFIDRHTELYVSLYMYQICRIYRYTDMQLYTVDKPEYKCIVAEYSSRPRQRYKAAERTWNRRLPGLA